MGFSLRYAIVLVVVPALLAIDKGVVFLTFFADTFTAGGLNGLSRPKATFLLS